MFSADRADRVFESSLFISFALIVMLCGSALQPESSRPVGLEGNVLQQTSRQVESETCPSSVAFMGEVRRGVDYDYKISTNLRFHLQASDDGWHIEIVPQKPREDGKYPDFAWPLNPPYRGYNALNVSGSYDFTAKDVIAYPREFRFPLDEVDAERAFQIYQKLESSTGQEFEEAKKQLDHFPSGAGRFVITSSRLSPSSPANQNRGRIEWLKFKVSMILPCRTAASKP
jgi:hypothetical protein